MSYSAVRDGLNVRIRYENGVTGVTWTTPNNEALQLYLALRLLFDPPLSLVPPEDDDECMR